MCCSTPVPIACRSAKMSAFLTRDGVVPNKVLPADGANLDCGGAVVSLVHTSRSKHIALVHTSRQKHIASMLCSFPRSWIKLSSHQQRMISLSINRARLQSRGVHRRCSLFEMRRMTLSSWCERRLRTHHGPLPEPSLRPLRHEGSEEDMSEAEQKTSVPRSAEKAKRKPEQQAKMRVTLKIGDVCKL